MESEKRYSGKVLSVLWTAQFVCVPLHILALAFVVMECNADLGWVPWVYIAELCFFSVCFLIMPMEISAYLFNFLNPWCFLLAQVFKTFFYSICAGYAIYQATLFPLSISKDFWNIWRWVNLGLVVLLLLAFLVELCYSGIVLHRYRKIGTTYDQMVPAEDAQDRPATLKASSRLMSRAI